MHCILNLPAHNMFVDDIEMEYTCKPELSDQMEETLSSDLERVDTKD